MEVSALKYTGVVGRHGRSPLLRLQSDERLIAFVRRGNHAAFETLVSRYEARLLSFCRHLLGSREDAEDVLQEVFASAYNAVLADERPINARPWLYRIARNRSLNHLRRIQAVPVDSMDLHLSDHGDSAADKVHSREEFRLLVDDIQGLPETQRTALLLREMDALSYEQIAEAMETTVPSVKSLLVRARVSLAEAAEARLLSCDEVRIELGEIAEGLRRRPSPLVRRHLKACERCSTFRSQLRHTNKALAALLPIGPLIFLKKAAIAHLGHSAGAGSSAAGSGATAAAAGTGVAGTGVLAGSAGGLLSASVGAIATKAAAGLAVATLVTAGAVEVDSAATHHAHRALVPVASGQAAETSTYSAPVVVRVARKPKPKRHTALPSAAKKEPVKTATPVLVAATTAAVKPVEKLTAATPPVPAPEPGRLQTTTDTTILPTTTTPTPAALLPGPITEITSTTATANATAGWAQTSPAPGATDPGTTPPAPPATGVAAAPAPGAGAPAGGTSQSQGDPSGTETGVPAGDPGSTPTSP
jgi:RNA polymerase sigma factor (sigma-70 family)